MQVVVVFAAGAAMTTSHNFHEGIEMPTIADFTGAGHLNRGAAFAVAQRAVLPGRMQAAGWSGAHT